MQKLRILLIEDQADIRNLLSEALEEAGFDVSEMPDNRQALATLESQVFHAVVTDIDLGQGPDGWDVARRAREVIPDLPVVYMTGTAGDDWTSKGVPNSVLITKPFAPMQIVTAISSLLNVSG